MPVVRRFRTLGQVRKDVSDSSVEKVVEVQKMKSDSRSVKRFESQLGSRKVRKDKKHHFPLRVGYEIWDKVDELSLACGSLSKGASLNVICVKLLSYALDDELIVKRILKEFPGNDRYVLVRSWRNV